jgi:3',5'-cyclic AMP phosphodiesterase CpdA
MALSHAVRQTERIGILLPRLAEMRIALVSDSHLAPSAPACNSNWQAVREYVACCRADLTIHLGDITLDAETDASQLEIVRSQCDAWPSPFRFIPGNHDIGDNPPGPNVPAKHPLDTNLLEKYRGLFGPDFWIADADGWSIIGLNAQLFGSGSTEEEAQWRWLEKRVDEAGTRPVVLMQHKPLFQNTRDDARPHIRYVPLEPRRRLLAMLARLNFRILFSGHTHQYLDRTFDGVRHIWIPSTSFFIPDSEQERVGEKVVGLGLLEIEGAHSRFDLVCPEGVTRNSLVEQPFYRILK